MSVCSDVSRVYYMVYGVNLPVLNFLLFLIFEVKIGNPFTGTIALGIFMPILVSYDFLFSS